MPCPVLAEILATGVSPFQISVVMPFMDRSVSTRSISALSLSILLIAIIIGVPAARAWSMASAVCGITPSSAATTITTISVALAPRARIELNAACPGVSRKVIIPFAVST